MHFILNLTFFIAVLVILIVNCVSTSNLQACPSSESIKSCSCHLDDYMFFSCNGENGDNTVEGLQQALTVLDGKSKVQLDLKYYNLGHLPSNIFHDLDIVKLSFVKCNISKFETENNSPVFHGLEDSLRVLRIDNSIAESALETFTLKLDHLKKLRYLDISDNLDNSRIYSERKMSVGNDWFENGPSSLAKIVLHKNHITSFGDVVFSKLANLQELLGDRNEIEVIQRSMFPDSASRLISINLAYNKLESLPEDIFTNMPYLQRVNLEGNPLEVLDQRTWELVWEHLDVLKFGEYLNCDTSIDWVFAMRRPRELQALCHMTSTDLDKRGEHLDKLIDENQQRRPSFN